MIEYLKCNCVKYSIPDEEYNIPIKLSPNKKEMLIAVVNTKNNIVLYKIINTEIIYFDILYTGVS